jgi:hypothetical protein
VLSDDARCELCCFAASCLAIAAPLLIVLAVDYSEHSRPYAPWIAAAGIAFALMVVLTIVAVRAARHKRSAPRGAVNLAGDT